MAAVAVCSVLLADAGWTQLTVPGGADTPIHLGDGIDSLTGQQKSSCLATWDDEPGVGGYGTSEKFRRLTSTLELRQSQEVSAQASLGLGIFSGSAAYRWTQSSSASRYVDSAMWWIQVAKPPDRINNLRLRPDAQELYDDPARWFEFRALCGTHVVTQRVGGGSLYAVISFSKSSTAQAQENSTALDFAVGANTMSAAVVKRFSQLQSSRQLSVEAYRNGTKSDIGTGSVEGLAEAAATFVTGVRERSEDTPVKFYALPYSSLFPGPPIDTRKLLVLDELGQLMERIEIARASLQHAESLGLSGFSPMLGRVSATRVRALLAEVNKARLDLLRAAEACGREAAPCAVPDVKSPPIPPLAANFALDPHSKFDLCDATVVASPTAPVLVEGAGYYSQNCPSDGVGGTQRFGGEAIPWRYADAKLWFVPNAQSSPERDLSKLKPNLLIESGTVCFRFAKDEPTSDNCADPNRPPMVVVYSPELSDVD